MKKQYLVVGVLVVCVSVGLGWWWLQSPRKIQNNPTSTVKTASVPNGSVAGEKVASPPKKTGKRTPEEEYGPYRGMSADELWRVKPKMFKAERYPPETPEEITMWQWWRAMRDTDRSFESKMAIEFYGKVLDQHNQSVEGATVNLRWMVPGGTQPRELLSGSDGTFEFKGVQGRGLSVEIYKQDYRAGKESKDRFDYAQFFERNFHVPDPANPVIFRLWKYRNPEPMYKWDIYKTIEVNKGAAWIEAEKGKLGAESGDFAVIITRANQTTMHEYEYGVRVQAANGSGMALSNEEFMFQAPESGYQTEFSVSKMPEDKDFHTGQRWRFYLRMQSGKYAAVELEVRQMSKPEADVLALIYYNPSGSRNLEFDDKKQINR